MISESFARELEPLLFPIKLFKLAESEKVESIQWSREGKAVKFNTEILPKECFVPGVFNIANCKHLFRQLSYYGFNRISKFYQICEFQHPYFCSDRFDLIQYLRRPGKKRSNISHISVNSKAPRGAKAVKKSRHKLTESEFKSIEPFIEKRKSARLQNKLTKQGKIDYSFLNFESDGETDASIKKRSRNKNKVYSHRKRNTKDVPQQKKGQRRNLKRKMRKYNLNSKKKISLDFGTEYNQALLSEIRSINAPCVKQKDLHPNETSPIQDNFKCNTHYDMTDNNIENSANSLNFIYDVCKRSTSSPYEAISYSDVSHQLEKEQKPVPLNMHTDTQYGIDSYNSQHERNEKYFNAYDGKFTIVKDQSEEKYNDKSTNKNYGKPNITSDISKLNRGKYFLNNSYKWEPVNELESQNVIKIKQSENNEGTQEIKPFAIYTSGNQNYYMHLNNSNILDTTETTNVRPEIFSQNTLGHEVTEYTTLGEIDKNQEMLDSTPRYSDSTSFGSLNPGGNFPTFIKQEQNEFSTEYETFRPLVTSEPTHNPYIVTSNIFPNTHESVFNKPQNNFMEAPIHSNGRNQLNFRESSGISTDNPSMFLPICYASQNFNMSQVSTASESNLSSEDLRHGFSGSQSLSSPHFALSNLRCNQPNAIDSGRQYFHSQSNGHLSQATTQKTNKFSEFEYISSRTNSVNTATKQTMMDSNLQNRMISKIDNRKIFTDQMSSNFKNDNFLTYLSSNIYNRQETKEDYFPKPSVTSTFNKFVEVNNINSKLSVPQKINSNYRNSANRVDQIVNKDTVPENQDCNSNDLSVNHLTLSIPLEEFIISPALKQEPEISSISNIQPANQELFTSRLPVSSLLFCTNSSNLNLPLEAKQNPCEVSINYNNLQTDKFLSSTYAQPIVNPSSSQIYDDLQSRKLVNIIRTRAAKTASQFPLFSGKKSSDTINEETAITSISSNSFTNKIDNYVNKNSSVCSVTNAVASNKLSNIPTYIISQKLKDKKHTSPPRNLQESNNNMTFPGCSSSGMQTTMEKDSEYSKIRIKLHEKAAINDDASGSVQAETIPIDFTNCNANIDIHNARKGSTCKTESSHNLVKDDHFLSEIGQSAANRWYYYQTNFDKPDVSVFCDFTDEQIPSMINTQSYRHPDMNSCVDQMQYNGNPSEYQTSESEIDLKFNANPDILQTVSDVDNFKSGYFETKQIDWHQLQSTISSKNYNDLVTFLHTQLKNKKMALSDILDSPNPRVRYCAYDVLTFEAEKYLSNTKRNPLFH